MRIKVLWKSIIKYYEVFLIITATTQTPENQLLPNNCLYCPNHLMLSRRLQSFFVFFFSIWVFLYKHLRITELQGKGEDKFLTPHYHFHPLRTWLYPCNLGFSYHQVHMCLLYPRILTSSYPEVHVCLLAVSHL